MSFNFRNLNGHSHAGIEKSGTGVEKSGTGIEKSGTGIEKSGTGISSSVAAVFTFLLLSVTMNIAAADFDGTLYSKGDDVYVSFANQHLLLSGSGTRTQGYALVPISAITLDRRQDARHQADINVAGSGTGAPKSNGNASSKVDVAGSGTGAPNKLDEEGIMVAGSGTGAPESFSDGTLVAGSGTGSHSQTCDALGVLVAGSGTGAPARSDEEINVAGSGTGKPAAKSDQSVSVAGSGTGAPSAEAHQGIAVAGSGTGAPHTEDLVVMVAGSGTGAPEAQCNINPVWGVAEIAFEGRNSAYLVLYQADSRGALFEVETMALNVIRH